MWPGSSHAVLFYHLINVLVYATTKCYWVLLPDWLKDIQKRIPTFREFKVQSKARVSSVPAHYPKYSVYWMPLEPLPSLQNTWCPSYPCSHLHGAGLGLLCAETTDSVLHLGRLMSTVPHFLPQGFLDDSLGPSTSTWYLQALNPVGYAWPMGDRSFFLSLLGQDGNPGALCIFEDIAAINTITKDVGVWAPSYPIQFPVWFLYNSAASWQTPVDYCKSNKWLPNAVAEIK